MQKEIVRGPLISSEDLPEKIRRHKILIVDDDPSIRSILSLILKENDAYKVLMAENGRQALDILKNNPVDAILSDIQMPEMNGLELLKEVKSHDPTLPVIMITGFPTIDVAIDSMKKGASDFITKPFKFDQVELILSRILHERELLLENVELKKALAQTKKIEVLNQKLSEKIKELTIMYSISESMSGPFNSVDQVLEKALEIISNSLNCKCVSVLFMDRRTRKLYMRAAKGLSSEVMRDAKISIGEGITGKVFELGRPLLVKDVGELDENLKGGWFYKTRSLISVPLFIQKEPFGVINVSGKIGDIPFTKDDVGILEMVARKISLNIENVILYNSVYDNLLNTLRALVKTLEAKDSYTQQHSERVTYYAVQTAIALGCSEEEVETLRFAGYLHDIGKVGVKDTVLLKEGRLNESEFQEIMQHPIIGEEIVKHLELLPEERAIIRSHHERWDGTGYPDGLKGDETPFLARILAVCDAYDAMTSSRPYRNALSHEAAMKELTLYKWRQFDGDVVDAFSSIIDNAKKRIEKMATFL
jgi:putative nucleotidyltransferase with HDIG domain